MSQISTIKRAQKYLLRIERNEFSKKIVALFLALCYLSSRCDISTIVTSNQTRSKLMEARHPDLSSDTKCKEIWALKGIQTAARILDQNQEKFEIRQLGEELGDAKWGVAQHTSHGHMSPCGGYVEVCKNTSIWFSPLINTLHPFLEK